MSPKNRPYTTLFLVTSLDGKISSGDRDVLDVDSDWNRINGVKEGLYQYYDLEKQTDSSFFQSGRVFAKIGINQREPAATSIPVTGVIIDNKPHLTKKGIRYLASWLKRIVIITTNRHHLAKDIAENVHVLECQKTVDFKNTFKTLLKEYGIKRMTIQSGGTLNAELLRAGLIDELSIIIAPLLVGGATTSTLIDGEALHTIEDLKKLKAPEFISCNLLKHSYIHLCYRVIQETGVLRRKS
jgi:2,5-diamino-6-(ribosylamino)-4(3H)-pyrimidinone 5'-phosphate reductase